MAHLRVAGFCYEKEDVEIILNHGADGIAFGFLNADVTLNPYFAMETLIDLHVDRVLTSGQQAKAMDGIDLIQKLNQK